MAEADPSLVTEFRRHDHRQQATILLKCLVIMTSFVTSQYYDTQGDGEVETAAGTIKNLLMVHTSLLAYRLMWLQSLLLMGWSSIQLFQTPELSGHIKFWTTHPYTRDWKEKRETLTLIMGKRIATTTYRRPSLCP